MHFHFLALFPLSFLFSTPLNLLEREKMGRFKCLVESEEGIVSFRANIEFPPTSILDIVRRESGSSKDE